MTKRFGGQAPAGISARSTREKTLGRGRPKDRLGNRKDLGQPGAGPEGSALAVIRIRGPRDNEPLINLHTLPDNLEAVLAGSCGADPSLGRYSFRNFTLGARGYRVDQEPALRYLPFLRCDRSLKLSNNADDRGGNGLDHRRTLDRFHGRSSYFKIPPIPRSRSARPVSPSLTIR